MLDWRLEAWRTRTPFAKIAAEHSLIYRVEQIFLVHRETNRWLLHVAADPALAQNAKLQREIEEFVRDFFFASEEFGLEEFHIEEKRIWIAAGPQAYLAAVIAGNPPQELRRDLQDAIARVNAEQVDALWNFHGDTAPFAATAPQLVPLLTSAHRPVRELPRLSLPRIELPRFTLPRVRLPGLTTAWPIILGLLALLLVAGSFAIRSERRWRQFTTRLKAEPGILVARDEQHWFRRSNVVGLRDPLARDPSAIAEETKLNPARIRFEWKEYVAADAAIVLRRFYQRFGKVEGAQITLQHGQLQITGVVPNEWLEKVRREATQIAGISSVSAREATVAFDPGRALEQFKKRFAPPPTVNAVVANNTLVLAGRAPFEWVGRIRDEAQTIPGITAINGDALVVQFDSDLVRERFRERFGLPEGVQATVQGGRLILSGEAPHAWLDQVRRGAMQIPGVRVLDDRKIEDIDQREFHETKDRIDAAAVVFVLNRDTIPPDARAAITRVLDDVRRCLTAAQNMGVNAMLELRGYGDAVSSDAANAELSKRRAEAVRTFLIESGLDERKVIASGAGTPPPPGPGEKPGAGKFDRRVFFQVSIQP